jgi:hypothetical protein
MTRQEKQTRATKRASGLTKHFAGQEIWPGTQADDIVKKLQAHLSAMAAVEKAEIARAASVAKERRLAEELVPIYQQLDVFLKMHFGANIRALADFALRPEKKRGPKRAEAKAAMGRKARATRAARGTNGKRRRR